MLLRQRYVRVSVGVACVRMRMRAAARARVCHHLCVPHRTVVCGWLGRAETLRRTVGGWFGGWFAGRRRYITFQLDSAYLLVCTKNISRRQACFAALEHTA